MKTNEYPQGSKKGTHIMPGGAEMSDATMPPEGSPAEEATETPTEEAAETPEKEGAEQEAGTEVSEEFQVQADDLLKNASPAELEYIQKACTDMSSKSAASKEPTMEDYAAAKEQE